VKSLQSRSVTLSQLGDGDADKLEPAQIVDILIEEFGSLTPDDEEEKLVFEADGCMSSQDVFILVQFNPHSMIYLNLRQYRSYVAGCNPRHNTSNHVPCILIVDSSRSCPSTYYQSWTSDHA
jgi:hypothetical protein